MILRVILHKHFLRNLSSGIWEIKKICLIGKIFSSIWLKLKKAEGCTARSDQLETAEAQKS